MFPSKNKNLSFYRASAFLSAFVSVVTNAGADDTAVKEATGPHGLHRAAATMKGSRRAMEIDGTAGPVFDELIWIQGEKLQNFNQMVHREAKDGGMDQSGAPVVFSEDGTRYAYVGRQGNDFVIILDGKEFA